MRKVDRRNSQLYDIAIRVLLGRSRIFLASIYDCTDTQCRQGSNVRRKGISSEKDIFVDLVPPISYFQNASQQHIPPQSGIKNRASVYPVQIHLRHSARFCAVLIIRSIYTSQTKHGSLLANVIFLHKCVKHGIFDYYDGTSNRATRARRCSLSGRFHCHSKPRFYSAARISTSGDFAVKATVSCGRRKTERVTFPCSFFRGRLWKFIKLIGPRSSRLRTR